VRGKEREEAAQFTFFPPDASFMGIPVCPPPIQMCYQQINLTEFENYSTFKYRNTRK
jgi:hypothetical protein